MELTHSWILCGVLWHFAEQWFLGSHKEYRLHCRRAREQDAEKPERRWNKSERIQDIIMIVVLIMVSTHHQKSFLQVRVCKNLTEVPAACICVKGFDRDKIWQTVRLGNSLLQKKVPCSSTLKLLCISGFRNSCPTLRSVQSSDTGVGRLINPCCMWLFLRLEDICLWKEHKRWQKIMSMSLSLQMRASEEQHKISESYSPFTTIFEHGNGGDITENIPIAEFQKLPLVQTGWLKEFLSFMIQTFAIFHSATTKGLKAWFKPLFCVVEI